MNRGRFLKALIGIVVAPKVLTEVNLPVPIKEGSLFADLTKMAPSYYEQMVARYGNESYALLMEQAVWQGSSSEAFAFYEREKPRGLIGSIINSDKV